MLRFRNTIEDENLHQWLTTGIQNYRPKYNYFARWRSAWFRYRFQM